MTRPIVVGVDGSDRGLDAVVLARLLGVSLGAPLMLACCYGREVSMVAHAAAAHQLEVHETAEEHLDRAAELVGSEVSWDARAVATSSPARGLTEVAEESDALAVVVGSTHRGRAGRVVAGAVGERLVHAAPCAVAVAPREYRAGGFRDVGAAYDGTAEATAALHGAAVLARAAGARLHLVNVLEPPNPANPLFAMTAHGYTEALGDLREMHRDGLDEASRSISTSGLAVQTELLEGEVVAELVARSGSLDLLAIGSRRYGAARRAAAGAVSIGVLREAACPVLLLPRGIASPFAASSGPGT